VSLVVLLILASVWAVFLVPQVLRARADRGPSDSIGAFRAQLSVLERATPVTRTGPLARPASRMPSYAAAYGRPVSQRELARKRRRDVLFGLLGAMGVTLLLGLIVTPLLLVHVVLDGLFVGYCALLVRARNVAAEREMKVRYLPSPSLVTADSGLLLQRANG
jgi:hypothetical protein